ncbi:hypothetical protein PIB30_065369 [Stylosanthes scabra]|uniref:Uncharacterized protein n=1 Tax=Stylosanthes scabra TaxID=79078 RepID=A0ABU6XJT9_9FABA|nr:hypothetical protein [Stylosanthes scabra]
MANDSVTLSERRVPVTGAPPSKRGTKSLAMIQSYVENGYSNEVDKEAAVVSLEHDNDTLDVVAMLEEYVTSIKCKTFGKRLSGIKHGAKLLITKRNMIRMSSIRPTDTVGKGKEKIDAAE